ncbi:MAG TPA: hydrogenase maturation peptidase HycI, partial [Bacillota bacterium]|nr:hydrogenase maturation peptidase HycI [Bacillota bacterium]
EALTALADTLNSGSRVAFLGVGSPLRGDDAVGLYLLEGLKARLSSLPGERFQFYRGESAPENFTGVIREFAPAHLVILDAAELGEAPGSFRRINPEDIAEVSFTTHILPLKILVAYFNKVMNCEILIIGVQPQHLEFATTLSSTVQKAADDFLEELLRI